MANLTHEHFKYIHQNYTLSCMSIIINSVLERHSHQIFISFLFPFFCPFLFPRYMYNEFSSSIIILQCICQLKLTRLFCFLSFTTCTDTLDSAHSLSGIFGTSPVEIYHWFIGSATLILFSLLVKQTNSITLKLPCTCICSGKYT